MFAYFNDIVNQIGQSFSTFNEVVSESVGAITLILLFIQGISAGLLEEDIIEVSQTYMSILQSSNDVAARKAETVSKSIIQSCEDINYILVLSPMSDEAKLILEYAPIGATPITNTVDLKELRANFQTDSVNSKPQVVHGNLSKYFPVTSQNNRNNDATCKFNDISGNTWVISISKNEDEAQDSKKLASTFEWISKLLHAPI